MTRRVRRGRPCAASSSRRTPSSRYAARWRPHGKMPFASSRGYSSLTLQHDAAQMLNDRYARTEQTAIVYFVSDLDPSGLDLQPLVGRGAGQFRRPLHPRPHRPHPRSSARQYGHPRPAARASRHQGQEQRQPRPKLYQAGDICWEANILPGAVIEALDAHIGSWLDHDLWGRRISEIERARKLL